MHLYWSISISHGFPFLQSKVLSFWVFPSGFLVSSRGFCFSPSGFLFLCIGLMVLGCFLLFCIQRFELFSVCPSGFLFSALILLFFYLGFCFYAEVWWFYSCCCWVIVPVFWFWLFRVFFFEGIQWVLIAWKMRIWRFLRIHQRVAVWGVKMGVGFRERRVRGRDCGRKWSISSSNTIRCLDIWRTTSILLVTTDLNGLWNRFSSASSPSTMRLSMSGRKLSSCNFHFALNFSTSIFFPSKIWLSGCVQLSWIWIIPFLRI